MPMLACTSRLNSSSRNGGSRHCDDRLGRCREHRAAPTSGTMHRELVAAESSDHAAFGKDALDTRPDLAQQRITGLMTERVVDLLEAIEVDQQHGAAASTCFSRSRSAAR